MLACLMLLVLRGKWSRNNSIEYHPLSGGERQEACWDNSIFYSITIANFKYQLFEIKRKLLYHPGKNHKIKI